MAFSFSSYTHSMVTCTLVHVFTYGTYVRNFYWNDCRPHDALPPKLPHISSKDILLHTAITLQHFYLTTIISNVNSLFKFLQVFQQFFSYLVQNPILHNIYLPYLFFSKSFFCHISFNPKESPPSLVFNDTGDFNGPRPAVLKNAPYMSYDLSHKLVRIVHMCCSVEVFILSWGLWFSFWNERYNRKHQIVL